MPPLTRVRRLAGIIAAAILVGMINPVAHAEPSITPGPTPYQCPGSNAHVWDKDQCARIGEDGFELGGGGGPRRGFLGRLLDGLTGGLL